LRDARALDDADAARRGAASDAVLAWRLDRQPCAATEDSGIGAEKLGDAGTRRASAPCTALPIRARRSSKWRCMSGFPVMDTVPHVLTCVDITQAPIHVVQPEVVPNPAC
jgi:hypothetical protein